MSINFSRLKVRSHSTLNYSKMKSIISDDKRQNQKIDFDLSQILKQNKRNLKRDFTIEQKSVENDCIRSLQKNNEMLQKENEFLKKKNETLKSKIELMTKENESLKELLSKKVDCSICEKLYSKWNAFYLHLQFDNDRHRIYAMKRYDIKCDTCWRKLKRWDDFRKHMMTHKLKMSKATINLDIENDTSKFFVAISHKIVSFQSKLTFYQTCFDSSKQYITTSKNQINVTNE